MREFIENKGYTVIKESNLEQVYKNDNLIKETFIDKEVEIFRIYTIKKQENTQTIITLEITKYKKGKNKGKSFTNILEQIIDFNEDGEINSIKNEYKSGYITGYEIFILNEYMNIYTEKLNYDLSKLHN